MDYSFDSSESTNNFSEADITVSGGVLSDFTATTSAVYSAIFTPSAVGATTIDVAANTFTDAVGNNNTAATQFNWTYKTNFIVNKDGSDDYTTIAAAINSVASGDTITVKDGTYTENISISKNLVIQTNGSDVVIIDGNNNGSTVSITNSANVTLDGLNITKGRASGSQKDGGGGIHISSSGKVALNNL